MIRTTALVFALLLAAPALAQNAPPPNITLTLSTNEVQEIWTALGERPAKFSGPVMSKIQKQVDEQAKPPEPKRVVPSAPSP